MAAKEKYKIKEAYPTAEFAAALRRLADALEKSEGFEMQIGAEGISIPAGAECKIEYEREGNKGEIECKIKWKEQ
jgi:amphi-Trp domain-containing protein